MAKYFGALTLVLALGIVLTRVFLLRQQGIQAMKFGNIDKTDFFIPPFALFYFYVVLAAAFNWPTVNKSRIFPLRNNLLDRSVVLPYRTVIVVVERRFL